jgi:endonuclease III
MKNLIDILFKNFKGRFSKSLGIELKEKKSDEIFKWFLASILYGARIGEKIATNTYYEFEKRNVLTPEKILKTEWDGLVEILDMGGYVRYDFKTATKLLNIMKIIQDNYDNNLNNMHEAASDFQDLENKLIEMPGIGPTTANIFLRELRGIWEKADPNLSSFVEKAAYNLNLLNIFGKDFKQKRKNLNILKEIWNENRKKGYSFSDFEACLVRLGKDFCRKKQINCPLRNFCKNPC